MTAQKFSRAHIRANNNYCARDPARENFLTVICHLSHLINWLLTAELHQILPPHPPLLPHPEPLQFPRVEQPVQRVFPDIQQVHDLLGRQVLADGLPLVQTFVIIIIIHGLFLPSGPFLALSVCLTLSRYSQTIHYLREHPQNPAFPYAYGFCGCFYFSRKNWGKRLKSKNQPRFSQKIERRKPHAVPVPVRTSHRLIRSGGLSAPQRLLRVTTPITRKGARSPMMN